jgi:hypothetical protein
MAAYVELPIDENHTITVEVSETGLVRAGAGGKVGAVADRFDEALAQVVRMGRNAVDKARRLPQPPSSIEVELGLKLTARAGFVVAESSGEANFKIVLKWTGGDA